MRSVMQKSSMTGLAVAALLAGTAACAQDVELLVKHTAVSYGPDGVKRSTEFSERVSRAKDTLWISRVLPKESHSDHDHAKGGKEHKHIDVTTASRWISRDASGAIQMRLVPNDEKVVVAVSKTDYGNVGFDGSWAAAWSLVDPATLKRMKRMKPVGVAGDLTTYVQTEQDRSVKVVWNSKLQMPVSVESNDKTSRRQSLVQVVSSAPARPWEKLQGFTQKDYSDYLD